MKILAASDLHLEFEEEPEIPSSLNFRGVDRDVLVLAGDVHMGPGALPFIMREVMDTPVIYVCGNHEFYNHEVHSVRRFWSLIEQAVPGFHFLDNTAIVIDGVLFAGGTLWTDMNKENPVDMEAIYRGMNDYRLVRYGDRGLQPSDAVAEHKKTVVYLNRLFTDHQDIEKKVVVTHMAPTTKSLSNRYNPTLNAGYASDLSELILKHNPDLWIHGHVHECQDYMVGDKTRVFANPRGYPFNSDARGGNSMFNRANVITI